MSDSNQVNILYKDEAVIGEIVVPGAADSLRFNSESLTASYNDEESPEIDASRQVTDIIQLGRSNSGDIVTSLSYGNLDSIIESGMYNVWGGAIALDIDGVDFGAPAAGNGGTVTGSAAANVALDPGDWAFLEGGNAANSGWKQVQAISDALITFAPPSACVVQNNVDIIVKGSIIKNGITRKSISIVKQFSQLAPIIYHSYAGCVVDSFAVEVRSESSISATITLQGTKHAQEDANPFGAVAANAKLTNPIMSAAVNVGEFAEGGVITPASTIVTGLTFTLANNLRQSRDIGEIDPADIRSGRANVSGQIEVYFQDGDLYEKLVDRTETSFSWILEDDNNNSYVFAFPRVRLRNGRVLAGGADTDIIAQYDFQALRHRTYDYTFQIGRNAA